MTVIELIEHLTTLAPELPVYVMATDFVDIGALDERAVIVTLPVIMDGDSDE